MRQSVALQSTIPRPASLRRLLRQAHLRFAVVAVALVGAALTVPGLITLHVYAENNLRLVGRAISYTLEAAVVFGDRDAAQSELRTIVESEDVSEVVVTAMNGTVLARWDAPTDGWRSSLGQAVARLLFNGPADIPILHDGTVAGQVRIWGRARMLFPLILYGASGVLLCQLAAVIGALYLAGRLQRRIVVPLRTLVDITATVQRERTFSRRVPRSDLRELNELGDTFNLLLGELESWHAGLTVENARLLQDASVDGLTGLWNRSYFMTQLEGALKDARITAVPLTVMLFDCNGFKPVNDTYGHAAGDAVLVTIAARFREKMRRGDVVARLGGDEFAVLLVPAPPSHALAAIVAAVKAAAEIPIPVQNGQTVSVGLAVGCASYPEHAADAAGLLHCADLAMYRNKPNHLRTSRER